MAGLITTIGNSKVCLDFADGEGSAIVNGRRWSWEFHERGGPLFLRKDGRERKCQNPNKAVWKAFERWHRKYRKDKNASR